MVATMQNTVRYPLGIQTFEKIIEGGYLYVDKTEYVYRMTHSDSSYVFLSRPRRFGKSLLTSTLQSYFEGDKDLFKGLAIDKLEKEWIKYPVIHLDLSGGKCLEKDALERYLRDLLDDNAKTLGIEAAASDLNIYLKDLITLAKEKYNKQVVLLIDEYDAPLLDVVHNDAKLSAQRSVMQNFYSPIKKCDKFLKFVFITGITKFSQLSIFSELNNLSNISMLTEYAGICGITEQEMIQQMETSIGTLAEAFNWTKENTINQLKSNYDGYHFAWPSEDVYNPYSLLNAMANKKISSYWFGSGTPTYLITMLNKYNVTPAELGGTLTAMEDDFDTPTENLTDITPLLYQSGYATIKDYDEDSELYTLGIPNKEIRMGLFRNLLPNYVGGLKRHANTTAALMQVALLKDDIEGMLNLLKQFLGTIASVDYVNKPENYEAHWQQMFYTIFSLLGAKADVEIKTPKGRVDMVARTAHTLYLFEFKLNKSAEAAMKQIDLNDYAERFALCGLEIVKVGVTFNADERNITDWEICLHNS